MFPIFLYCIFASSRHKNIAICLGNANISNANYETRLAILRQKVQLESIVIDDIVLSNIEYHLLLRHLRFCIFV